MNDWRLSKRENQVMALATDGLNNDEIAETLGISVNSVNTFVSSIYIKYNISGKNCRTRAVLSYLRNIGRIK